MCDANTLEKIGYVWVCLCFSQCMYHVIDAIVFQFHWFCKLFASFCEQPLAPAMQTSNWFINYFSFHARPFLSLSHTLFFPISTYPICICLPHWIVVTVSHPFEQMPVSFTSAACTCRHRVPMNTHMPIDYLPMDNDEIHCGWQQKCIMCCAE